jgi:hypothetical protein
MIILSSGWIFAAVPRKIETNQFNMPAVVGHQMLLISQVFFMRLI